MSKERALLNLCAVTLKARNICPLLLKDISELLAQPEPTSEPVAWMVETYYTMLQEKLNRLTSEWVACHLTEEIVSGFYIRAKEELDLELAEKAHGIGVDDE